MTGGRKRGEGESAAGRPAALLLLMMAIGGTLAAQKPVARPPGVRGDTTRRGVPGQPVQGQALDTGAARRRGLPTGPSRSFPAPDAVLDSLLKLSGYRITQYVADTLVVQGATQTIFLRGNAFLDREGPKLEPASVRYRQASCLREPAGAPR